MPNKRIPRIENVVDFSRVDIRKAEDEYYICYDGIPLWRTTERLDQVDIFFV